MMTEREFLVPLTLLAFVRYNASLMRKSLLSILLLLTLVGNALAAFPPHQAGAGGCEASCCETAHQSGPAAMISGICCIVECPQTAETAPVIPANQNAQPALPSPFLFSSAFSSYLPSACFPSAPTRHLHGSSSRYLDCCSFLL
jgi:hypothetical protein